MAVEIKPLENFYPAEEYHQDYLDKNPGGYCHIHPELFDLARKAKMPKKSAPVYSKPDDAVLRSKLTPEQYAVTQKNATEPAFHNDYWDEHRPGIYVDITTVSLCLFQPISLIPVVVGPVSQSRLTVNLFKRK